MNSNRVIVPEVMDSATDEVVAINLRDIGSINRWFGGHRVTRQAFRGLTKPKRFTVLDVGAASGDNGKAIRRTWPEATVTSLDWHSRNLAQAEGPRVVADAFRLPFGPGAFDYVFCSLFLHHFADEEVVKLLAAFARVARRGVVVNDLERHGVAHKFLPATRWLFGWHAVTLHDGPVSVQAAFTPAELAHLALAAGLSEARVSRHLPWFRLSMVWERPETAR
jgi:ubiquinone/menaquinone biosynthesis C-methylase UbiE